MRGDIAEFFTAADVNIGGITARFIFVVL